MNSLTFPGNSSMARFNAECAMSPDEVGPVLDAAEKWLAAKGERNFVEADRLRGALLAAGVELETIKCDEDGKVRGAVFNPFREWPEHRRARLLARRKEGHEDDRRP